MTGSQDFLAGLDMNASSPLAYVHVGFNDIGEVAAAGGLAARMRTHVHAAAEAAPHTLAMQFAPRFFGSDPLSAVCCCHCLEKASLHVYA
jgi:hypothetical protein